MDKKQYHIFVCDDEESVLHLLCSVLIRVGYLVSKAKDGEEALEQLMELQSGISPVDLVLTDIMMPKVDGIELLTQLRAAGITIPLVAITGHGDKELVVDLLRHGFAGYLDKPFSHEQVLSTIQTVLEKVEEERRKDLLRLEDEEHVRLTKTLEHIMKDLDVLVAGMDKLNKQEIGFHFNHLLRWLRSCSGMTKLQIAKALDMNPAHYCALESEVATLPSLKDINKVSDLFGISCAALIAMAECPGEIHPAQCFPKNFLDLNAQFEKMRLLMKKMVAEGAEDAKK